MAITKETTRQSVQAVMKTISYADLLTSGVGSAICSLPAGAVVVGGHVAVDTNWNSATSAGLEIGDASSAARYLASENLLAAGDEFGALLTPGFAVTNATRNILAEVTFVGAPTAGSCRVVILYVVAGRATENFE
jgi:hypothetical protein